MSLICNLFFGTRDCGIVDVFLKCYARIVGVVEQLRFNGFIVANDSMRRIAGIVPFERQSCVAGGKVRGMTGEYQVVLTSS